MVIKFADISHHNAYDVNRPKGTEDTSDLRAYKAAGHDRIAIKISEGAAFVDPAARGRWILAKQLGLKRIGYHFLRNNFPGENQAEFFLSTVRSFSATESTDIYCVDTEDDKTPNSAKLCTTKFVERMVSRKITEGLIYSGRYYLNPHGMIANIFPAGWRKLWLADYSGSLDVPDGWLLSQVVARQFTDKQNVAGIGSCDYSQVLKEWIEDMPLTNDDLKLIEATVDHVIESRLVSHQTTAAQDPKLNPHNLADVLSRFGQWFALNVDNKNFDNNTAENDFSMSSFFKPLMNELNVINTKLDTQTGGISKDALKQAMIEALQEFLASLTKA